MSAIYQNLQSLIRGQNEIHFNPSQFVRENITRSWILTLWLAVMTYITVQVSLSQLEASPVTTIIVLVVWVLSVGMTVVNEITRNHSNVSNWLKNNLYSSITNVEITVVLTLLIIAAIQGFINWAFITSSFSTNPEVVAQTFEQLDAMGIEPGANWGAVIDNFRILMVFRFPVDETWRIFAVLFVMLALAVPSVYVYRGEAFRRSSVRRILTILWVLSPIVIYAHLINLWHCRFLSSGSIVGSWTAKYHSWDSSLYRLASCYCSNDLGIDNIYPTEFRTGLQSVKPHYLFLAASYSGNHLSFPSLF
jgi:hypothetical protein